MGSFLSFISLCLFILVFPQKKPRLIRFKSLFKRNLGPQKQIPETLKNPLRYMHLEWLRGKTVIPSQKDSRSIYSNRVCPMDM